MARVRVAVLSLGLIVAVGIGAVNRFSEEPKSKFCTAEGAMFEGEWLTKDDDCNWTKQDGTPILDEDGEPVSPSTPADKLPEGWGLAP